MKTINFTNQPDFEALEAAGIIMTSDNDMNLIISEEDYKRLQTEFPAAYMDSFIVKRYSVYICGITESKIATIMPDFKEARFDTEEEAREYIAEQLKGYQIVCPEDNNLDTANNHHWFELYDGDPITIDEDGDEHLNDPIFTSDMVYND